MESSNNQDLADLLTKLSLASNILPFFGYKEHSQWLMLQLSKDTRKLYKENREGFRKLESQLNSYKYEINSYDGIPDGQSLIDQGITDSHRLSISLGSQEDCEAFLNLLKILKQQNRPVAIESISCDEYDRYFDGYIKMLTALRNMDLPFTLVHGRCSREDRAGFLEKLKEYSENKDENSVNLLIPILDGRMIEYADQCNSLHLNDDICKYFDFVANSPDKASKPPLVIDNIKVWEFELNLLLEYSSYLKTCSTLGFRPHDNFEESRLFGLDYEGLKKSLPNLKNLEFDLHNLTLANIDTILHQGDEKVAINLNATYEFEPSHKLKQKGGYLHYRLDSTWKTISCESLEIMFNPNNIEAISGNLMVLNSLIDLTIRSAHAATGDEKSQFLTTANELGLKEGDFFAIDMEYSTEFSYSLETSPGHLPPLCEAKLSTQVDLYEKNEIENLQKFLKEAVVAKTKMDLSFRLDYIDGIDKLPSYIDLLKALKDKEDDHFRGIVTSLTLPTFDFEEVQSSNEKRDFSSKAAKQVEEALQLTQALLSQSKCYRNLHIQVRKNSKTLTFNMSPYGSEETLAQVMEILKFGKDT